jgi:hypothetical protein
MKPSGKQTDLDSCSTCERIESIVFSHRLTSRSKYICYLMFLSVNESTVEKVLRSIINDAALEGLRINEIAK